MKYTVVTHEGGIFKADQDAKEFIQKVNELLNQGWEPAGGISVTADNRWLYYTQALIKK